MIRTGALGGHFNWLQGGLFASKPSSKGKSVTMVSDETTASDETMTTQELIATLLRAKGEAGNDDAECRTLHRAFQVLSTILRNEPVLATPS